ncbi:MAG: LysR family transcriptional regulator [Candidatus Eiseniibacteriota bacterium]
MDFRQLRNFVVVADLENITLAASRLRIAQSAVSRHVRLLEQELGVRLFERVGRGIKLTSAGQMLRERVGHLLDEIKQLEDDITAEGTTPSGTLRVGANPSFGHTLFPRIAEQYWTKYPNVRLHFITDLTASIQELVRRGDLDVAIIGFPDKDPDFIKTPLTTEGIFLISAPDNNPGLGAECTVRAISKLPLLLPGFQNRERLGYERLAAAKGYHLTCRMEADSMAILKSLAARGFGHLLLPYVAIADDAPEGAWIMSRVKGFAVERYIIRLASRPLTEAGASMIRLIQSESRKLAKLGLIR